MSNNSDDNSDDELEENNYINKIFLNSENDSHNCYVCFIDTKYISPCDCKIYICNNCFINILKNNGEICTICKVKFDENILEKVKDEYEELRNVVSLEIDIQDINDDDEDEIYEEDNREDDYLLFIKVLIFLLSIPFLGFLSCFLIGYTPDTFINLATILMGIFSYFIIYFFLNIFIHLYAFIIYLLENILRFINSINYQSL